MPANFDKLDPHWYLIRAVAYLFRNLSFQTSEKPSTVIEPFVTLAVGALTKVIDVGEFICEICNSSLTPWVVFATVIKSFSTSSWSNVVPKPVSVFETVSTNVSAVARPVILTVSGLSWR